MVTDCDTSISPMSRPTSSQCRASTATVFATTSGSPNRLRRRVPRRPAGGATFTRTTDDDRDVLLDRPLVAQRLRSSPSCRRSSLIPFPTQRQHLQQSSRCAYAGRRGKRFQRPRYSCANQPTPSPHTARLPKTRAWRSAWSSTRLMRKPGDNNTPDAPASVLEVRAAAASSTRLYGSRYFGPAAPTCGSDADDPHPDWINACLLAHRGDERRCAPSARGPAPIEVHTCSTPRLTPDFESLRRRGCAGRGAEAQRCATTNWLGVRTWSHGSRAPRRVSRPPPELLGHTSPARRRGRAVVRAGILRERCRTRRHARVRPPPERGVSHPARMSRRAPVCRSPSSGSAFATGERPISSEHSKGIGRGS